MTKIFIAVSILVQSFSLWAGISGTLAGQVTDKETNIGLPGAAIFVKGTTLGAMADKNGYYIIHNLPAGKYDIQVKMIGYSSLIKKGIQINVDLKTEVNFSISTEILNLREIIVTNELQLIQKNVTSSAYFISGDDINRNLPIDSYLDAIQLLPGVVGGHVRGGRQTDVLYMLDGLPLQGALSREISSYFPNSSIVEMMVQTGGFTAEYGHANSGIINVVSKNGQSDVTGNFKFYSDFFDTGINDNDNTRRLDLNVSGPLTLGLGGPLVNAKYLISADLNVSDTQFREQMQRTFDTPIFTNYNINSKLSIDITKNTKLAFQTLLSNWTWHRYDPQWQLNLNGLAEHNHYNHRLSTSLNHTFSSKLFVSLKAARYRYNRDIMGGTDSTGKSLIFEDPTDPSSRILQGTQPWEEATNETIDMIKLDFVAQPTSNQFLKAGIDLQNHHISLNNFRLLPIPARGLNQNIVFTKVSNEIEYSPQFISFYVQNRIDLNGVTADLGLRYDIFNPEISIGALPDDFDAMRRFLQAPKVETKSSVHNPISPRLGISLPLSKNERLHLNYGWFYQMPPLYYLYTNTEHKLDSYLPVIGALELEPTKTIASEFSYKRTISDDILFAVTGFFKTFRGLIDTQTFILPDSLVTSDRQNVGFAKYTNSGSGTASGFEVTLQKQLTDKFTGRVSYTYMKARGTTTSAENEYERAVFENQVASEGDFPLSWDQRHSFILDGRFTTNKVNLSALYRLFSPLPFTSRQSTTPNDSRLSWRNILDVNFRWNSGWLGGRFKPFLEVRNVFDEDDSMILDNDRDVSAYRLFNPINSNSGRRLRLGIILDFDSR